MKMTGNLEERIASDSPNVQSETFALRTKVVAIDFFLRRALEHEATGNSLPRPLSALDSNTWL